MDFLEKLTLLMQRDGYNKSTLSKACGIPYTTIDNWFKRGYDGLQLSTLRKLNDFFHTTLEFWARDDITDPDYLYKKGPPASVESDTEVPMEMKLFKLFTESNILKDNDDISDDDLEFFRGLISLAKAYMKQRSKNLK